MAHSAHAPSHEEAAHPGRPAQPTTRPGNKGCSRSTTETATHQQQRRLHPGKASQPLPGLEEAPIRPRCSSRRGGSPVTARADRRRLPAQNLLWARAPHWLSSLSAGRGPAPAPGARAGSPWPGRAQVRGEDSDNGHRGAKEPPAAPLGALGLAGVQPQGSGSLRQVLGLFRIRPLSAATG